MIEQPGTFSLPGPPARVSRLRRRPARDRAAARPAAEPAHARAAGARAGLLAEELPNGTLLEASSILELRVAPERLTNEIADFIEQCGLPRPAQRIGTRAGRA